MIRSSIRRHGNTIDGPGAGVDHGFWSAALAGHWTDHTCASARPPTWPKEQLAGKEVSVQTDVYSLGLVLLRCSLVSGDGSERTAPATLTSLPKDIDPVVERVILQCLDVSGHAHGSCSRSASCCTK